MDMRELGSFVLLGQLAFWQDSPAFEFEQPALTK